MNKTTNHHCRELCAGPLRMRFENGDLRYIKWGGHEILRRVYAAVRDRNWDTIPSQISNLQCSIQEDSFQLSYDATHREREIDFVWRGEITGDEAGTIRFTFDGEARSTFLRNRIGFCVLHPAELAGQPCRARYANGSEYVTAFPELVAAEQPVKALHDLSAITHEVAPGLWAEVAFSGDLFEMEDQRNWIDASYKTFCTPLRLPFPLEIAAGTRIRQSVELRLHGNSLTAPAQVAQAEQGILITHTEQRFALPPLGLGLGPHPLSAREIEHLAKLKPAHLRVDVKLAEAAVDQLLARADLTLRQLDVPLEMALFLSENAAAELQSLVKWLRQQQPRVARWLIFDTGAKSSLARSLQLARQALREFGGPIGGGTNADFYQLNQFRPPADLMDFVAFSMNPQTHAFDDTSLVETLTVIPEPVRSARHYFNCLPVVISPVTLKPRFNAVATGATAEIADALPANVDVRQLSLFGAAWTLGALKRLAESAATSITCFETTGWRGVMETETGSPLPQQFPSLAGAVFPLYHVLADVAEFAGGEILCVQSGDPLKVEAILLERGERQSLVLANLTPETQIATLADIENTARLRRLNEQNVEAAMCEPETFRRQYVLDKLPSGHIELSPFEIVRLDR
jgi:D-apionolactonase